MIRFLILILATGWLTGCHAQPSFDYTIELTPIEIPELPGLHSYAFAQHDGKWLIIGGRKDGLHARQPFNSFPQAENNTSVYVVDIHYKKFWSAELTSLPDGLRDQLQSTNMNFYQDGNTLYIIGGYGAAESTKRHITFPYLTSVNVPSVIKAIINEKPIAPYFKQLRDDAFAVTGGQLGKIGNTFYLVGGHRFDGRYNPMGHPSYKQTYTNQIRMFTIDNSGSTLSFSNYKTQTDETHLRRRDFNLLPQIFPDGREGYMLSSGVFQEEKDLPYLYPVEITADGYTPILSFNQYLSNYHSAKVSLYDKSSRTMHMVFFGGMSQHYYEGETLVNDDLVPFVKTISVVSRFADGTLKEIALPVEMPWYAGASAEFIPIEKVPRYPSEIIKLNELKQSEVLIGYIYGGIVSPDVNPFSRNQASSTKASNVIFSVKLIKKNKPGS
jgi:hypothetical protein